MAASTKASSTWPLVATRLTVRWLSASTRIIAAGGCCCVSLACAAGTHVKTSPLWVSTTEPRPPLATCASGASSEAGRSCGAKRSVGASAVGPCEATPHEYICPASPSAVVWLKPHEIALHGGSPSICTGDPTLLLRPVPTCPLSASPQQYTIPAPESAALWLPPAASCAIGVPAKACTYFGQSATSCAPRPSCPSKPRPQEKTSP